VPSPRKTCTAAAPLYWPDHTEDPKPASPTAGEGFYADECDLQEMQNAARPASGAHRPGAGSRRSSGPDSGYLDIQSSLSVAYPLQAVDAMNYRAGAGHCREKWSPVTNGEFVDRRAKQG
jgi:hypothetical protein